VRLRVSVDVRVLNGWGGNPYEHTTSSQKERTGKNKKLGVKKKKTLDYKEPYKTKLRLSPRQFG